LGRKDIEETLPFQTSTEQNSHSMSMDADAAKAKAVLGISPLCNIQIRL